MHCGRSSNDRLRVCKKHWPFVWFKKKSFQLRRQNVIVKKPLSKTAYKQHFKNSEQEKCAMMRAAFFRSVRKLSNFCK